MSEKPTLTMTRGIPGSGKSFWADAQPDCYIVNKDDIRTDLKKTGWEWSHEREADVVKIRNEMIAALLREGKNVISSDTNFGKHERALRGLARQCKAEFRVQDFTTVPLEVCLERNAQRNVGTHVPEEVIRRMHREFVGVSPAELGIVPYVPKQGAPEAVLCDLDGTLCLHDGRSPYDVAKCGTDLLNGTIQKILLSFQLAGYEVIFLSGRDDEFRPQTSAWLTKHGWWGHQLFMRPQGDRRNDAIVKHELFDTHIREQYNVLCVLDDRDRVVKRWRELGLICLQVAYGDF